MVRPPIKPVRPRRRVRRHNADATPVWTAAQKRYLLQTYGLTTDQYDQMWHAQGGACYLWGKKSRRQRLSVDHDHETMRVRGLLCSRCNRHLGTFEWSVDVLRRLIKYAEAIIADREGRR